MFKAWINMWKNTFNYTATVTLKNYWLALIMNVISMYVGIVPFALISKLFTSDAILVATIYLIVVHLPALSLYFRRANDANWRITTSIFMAIGCPILSGIIVGAFPSKPKGELWPRFYSITGKLFALSFGIFFYGGLLGALLYGDPTSIPWLCGGGLLLGTGTLIFVGAKIFFEK